MHTFPKFHKVAVLDTVIFYPEHHRILHRLADEVVEYPSSLPESLERQYQEQPELFKNIKCYTELGADKTPLQLLMNRVEGADAIISCWTNIPDEILRLNPQLRLIVFWTHEKEHRVNVQLAEQLGITVKNIPDYGTDAVSEAVFAGLFELLLRNKPLVTTAGHKQPPTSAVLLDLFRYYRQLPLNEKHTRSGKFTHHFHKLGRAHFDFTQQNLDQLIPERLLEGKRIGFLGVQPMPELAAALDAFRVSYSTLAMVDHEVATFYKLLADNKRVYYDGQELDPLALQKAHILVPEKLVDIRLLPDFVFTPTDTMFGVLGLGRIGKQVAQKAAALGYKVLYHSRHRNRELEQMLGLSFLPLDELLQQSDVLSVHLPAHKADGVLNREKIGLLKPGAFFINTADGNITDPSALTDRMASGEVNAYLDVYPGLPRKDILGLPMNNASDWKLRLALPKSVLAYRAGWKTQESIRVKTYKLLGAMAETLLVQKNIPQEQKSSQYTWRDRREHQASVGKTEDGGLRPPLASIS